MKGNRSTFGQLAKGNWLALRVGAAMAVALGANSAIAQSPSPSAGTCDPAPAKAASVQGTVEARRVGDAQWRPVKLNDTFCPGDVIRVQERSRADVTMLDQSVLRLNANSSITIEAPKERRTGVVDLVRGTAHFFSRGPNSLEVKTPFTVAGVRGTEFLINVEDQQALLTVFEGTVVAQSPEGSLTMTDGQSAAAARGKPPVLRTVVRPRDAVHWALYYPPVVYFKPGEAPGGALDKPATGIKDPRVHVDRAQRLLAVGSVDQARAEIDSALKLAPNDANALSLQAIMAVVQGDKDRAYQVAQAAVSSAPNSGTALLARSFAEQARFDLEGARGSVQRAVEAEPDNALAWARLAEMHSSFGELDKAHTAAQRAVELQPDLSRTQAVRGFAQLLAVSLDEARQSFEKAIALDQADPLPRLGLGLAKIRGGDTEGGSRDIEVAASLDASNALVRSYLGKAYYEEKRGPLDERELNAAKQLDPLDPTPWFYDAIAKQTTNRPVEALENLDKAQELNSNRAVYRSQLLLDSDAAARSASQARIYSDLGFEQRALVEGWQAVNRDPTSFSAHRFLADSYSVLPRHEIARVSELLQSQLLAPVTNTPLQPRLAESNLFLISSGGPATASFNEFNPLFNRNGLSAIVNGMAGGMDTTGGDIVVAGVIGRAGFSAGYSKFKTDGFRVNANQNDEITNGFFQFDLTPQTSVQAEIRKRRNDWGDIRQRFSTDNFSSALRNTEDSDTYRLGLRHTFSPSSTVIGSLIHQKRDTTARDSEPVAIDPFTGATTLDVTIPEKATGGELQHIFRSRSFSLRSGFGYFKNERTDRVSIGIQLDPLVFPDGTIIPAPDFPPFQFDIPARTKHFNVYTYGTLMLPKDVNVILGASYDSIDGETEAETKNQFNPKLGLIWNVTPATTIRAAAFRVLKRTLITDQTLEPTQVAGFNQFYDDANFTESKRYGAAIDHKFSSRILAGIELSKRELTVPWTCANPECGEFGPREADWKEKLYRGYAFWAPHPWVALRAEYLFEKLDRAAEFTGASARELDSHRVPLGVRFFHPSGFGASLTATYWKQEGEFGNNPPFQSGKDEFWTTDAALTYRLPRRMGFIAVGATNLFDKQFRYLDIDESNPTVLPKRMGFVRLSLAFP